MFIAAHAMAATIALLTGALNLIRRAKGDRLHRRLGRVWVVAMYWTVVSSFAIKRLHPGHYSWIHLLSIWTFVSLTIGLWAALTHRIELHRGFMTGSYFGLLGAFIGAVAAPMRDVPQLAVHHPVVLVLAAFGCIVASASIVLALRGRTGPPGADVSPSLARAEAVRAD